MKTTALLLLCSTVYGVILDRDTVEDHFYDHVKLNHRNMKLSYHGGRADLTIEAYGLVFHLKMAEDFSIFGTDPDPQIEMCNGTATIQGRYSLVGETFGTIERDSEVFRGQFYIDDESYFVEEASKYFRSPRGFHSILYRASDVIKPTGKYESSALMTAPVSTHGAAQGLRNSICSLDIRFDRELFNKLGRDNKRLRDVVYRHTMALNRIYRSQVSISGQPVQFYVGRILVADDGFCNKNPDNIHCLRSPYNSDYFLEQFAKENHGDFCLSYLFTGHSFGTTLGVAYVEGLCASASRFQRLSQNCGFVANPGLAPQATTEITLAHEIGHNFGSGHDPISRSSCANHLMAPFVPNRETDTTRIFSSCSLRSIGRVLSDISEGRRRNCFASGRLNVVEEDPTGEPRRNGAATTSAAVIIAIIMIHVL